LEGNSHSLFEGTVLAFALRGLQKPGKSEIRTTGILIDVQTRCSYIQVKCCATDVVCLFFSGLLFVTLWFCKDGVSSTANKKLSL
jgi:hypothetical protein